ncbi:UDP-glucose dehydrogenase family protein [Pararhizobium polonicum]|uniref:UDP-glucose dehydrogenase family protein n=1 Tax=Pararhizobium polonicum TaxID=1612624 RepID=UPI00083A0781|nr:UDP-glucose/GDP-mannose dehydrogenase family protein [Pararhizobium polonicum]
MKIAIIGTGYVGLVSGACFAAWGHQVICVDIDQTRIDALNRGEVAIFEPGLTNLVESNLRSGQLQFTTDLKRAVRDIDVLFIAVGTPSSGHDGDADLSCVLKAAQQTALALCGPALIVTKSTVPVGTSERLEALMRSARPDADFEVASNPEFLREGSAIADFNKPDRVVLGCDSDRAKALLLALYRPLVESGVPMIITTRRSAELIKYAANAFLATKIAFINEMADLCEKVGANIDEIAIGMGMDKRIGAAFLKAGPGYGGSCFPKDTMALLRTAQEYGISLRLVEETIASNTSRKRTLGNRLRALLGEPLQFKKIAVLGLTFKAGTDDMRDAPSLTLIHALQSAGANVRAFDPRGMKNAHMLLRGVTFSSNPYECAEGADAIVLMTDWQCLQNLDFKRLGATMKRRVLLDLRGVYDIDTLVNRYGFTVERVGHPAKRAPENSVIRLKRRINYTPPSVEARNGIRNLPHSSFTEPVTVSVREDLDHE